MSDEQIIALLKHLRDCCDEVSTAANNAIKFGLMNIGCVTDDSNNKQMTNAMFDLLAAMNVLYEQGYLKQLEDAEEIVIPKSDELKARLMQ